LEVVAMLNINASEREQERLAAEARRESRKDVVRTIVFACFFTAIFFLPYYALTGSFKGAIALGLFFVFRILTKSRARRFVFSSWYKR
jgi:hypothetical protein